MVLEIAEGRRRTTTPLEDVEVDKKKNIKIMARKTNSSLDIAEFFVG